MDMTYGEFLDCCGKHSIDPYVALENPKVRAAIRARDLAMLDRVLTEEF